MANKQTVETDLKVNGVKYEVMLDPDEGTFSAEVDGEDVEAPTLKALIEKVRKVAKARKPIAIEASFMDTGGWRDREDRFTDIVIVGIHNGNGNVLYRTPSAPKAGTEQERYEGNFYRRITKPEREEYKRLIKAKDDAEKAIRRFLDERRLKNVRKLVEEASGS